MPRWIPAWISRSSRTVKEKLQPGRSALFLVTKEADSDALMAALRQFHGDIIQTTLPIEAESALR